VMKASFWRRLLSGVARYPEWVTFLFLVAAFVVSARLSPFFLDVFYIFDSTSYYVEIGILALAMTFVIITGNIDLSVASGLALVAVVTAMLHVQLGLPMEIVIVLSLGFGALLGLFNGLLVVKLGLPSLAVTLGTLALFRGAAQILAGDHSISGFPEWFIGADFVRVGGIVPLPLIVFIGLAVIFGLMLHKTVFGRYLYAIGANEMAARYAGLPVDRVKLAVFVVSGLMMSVGALLKVSRLSVARYDLAMGWELAVVTTVVLGGVHIYGGRGGIIGVVLALFVIGFLRTGMGVANIPQENQLVVIGLLLLVAVGLGILLERFRRN
jgi:rhamnose transport system permease protein